MVDPVRGASPLPLATPERRSALDEEPVRELRVALPNEGTRERKFFDAIAHRLGLDEAIKDGVITDAEAARAGYSMKRLCAAAEHKGDRRVLDGYAELIRVRRDLGRIDPIPRRYLETSIASGDYLVVAPRALHEALQPLLAHRAALGHKVALVAAEDVTGMEADPANALRAFLKETQRSWSEPRPKHLMIVGGWDSKQLPPHRQPMKTDQGFGDFDLDGRPELAVGRLPADTPEELEHMIASILDYEVERAPGLWQVRATLAEGDPGWGDFAGAAIEWFADLETRRSTPGALDLTRLSRNPESSIYDRDKDPTADLHALHYIGHGSDGWIDANQRAVLDTPLVSLAACLSANSLAPRALRDGRTVAVLASTEIAAPHAGPAITTTFSDEAVSGKAKTVGEMVQNTKERLTEHDTGALSALLLWLGDLVAAIMRWLGLTTEEVGRGKHVLMYNLIGDPGVRVRRPLPLKRLGVEKNDDGALVVTAEVPQEIGDAKAVVVLERRIGTVKLEPIDEKLPAEERIARGKRNAKRYNERVVQKAIIDVRGGKTTTTLRLPAGAKPGDYVVRVVAIGGTDVAVAAAENP